LTTIVAETEKEEKDLAKKSDTASKHIEERLLSAYHRIRSNARNGLAVVAVERGSCGGCFNSILPSVNWTSAATRRSSCANTAAASSWMTMWWSA
jgi:predicted  nucleic acid-binding Zn-ribbon protein